jgi:hypothetical protein
MNNTRSVRRQFWYNVGGVIKKFEFCEEFVPFSRCTSQQVSDMRFAKQRIEAILQRNILDENTAMFSTLWILKQLENSKLPPFLETEVKILEELLASLAGVNFINILRISFCI